MCCSRRHGQHRDHRLKVRKSEGKVLNQAELSVEANRASADPQFFNLSTSFLPMSSLPCPSFGSCQFTVGQFALGSGVSLVLHDFHLTCGGVYHNPSYGSVLLCKHACMLTSVFPFRFETDRIFSLLKIHSLLLPEKPCRAPFGQT